MFYINKNIYPIVIVMIAAVGLISCLGVQKQVEQYTGFVYSDIGRDYEPDVGPEDIDELVTGNSKFAFDLYQWLIQDYDNLIYSPYSISMALAITYAGADGQPKTDMADTMHFTLDDDRFHSAFNKVDLILDDLGSESAGDEGQPFVLNIANSLWVADWLTPRADFLDTIMVNYGAGLGQLDFEDDPRGSADKMNDWIAEKTEDRITDVIDPNDIITETLAFIVNAIYFLANWDLPFDEYATYDDDFHLITGDDVEVPMMRNTDHFNYSEGPGYQAVSLPYVGRETSMIIILPDYEEFEYFESSLDHSMVSGIMDDLDWENVRVTMPRFEYRSSINLTETLKDMGMESAFIDDPFPLMFEDFDSNTRIDKVIHEAFVKVDEEGTEAAAVTVVQMTTDSEIMELDEPIDFKMDHPFVFLIVDHNTKSILFIGRVLDPS